MLKKIFFISLVYCCLVGCQQTNEKSFSYSTSGFWHKDSIIKFNFKAPDTINKYDFFIHLRTTKDYKFNNLFVVASIQFPRGKIIVDTLEYKMAFKDGRLMGEGLGSLRYHKLWYKEGLRFREEGEYELNLRHAMRKSGETKTLTELQGVEEVGFSYEPLNLKKS